MLRDLDKTLQNILYGEGKIPRDEIEVVFEAPTREWSGALNRPTLSLWCFDIRENVARRVAGIDTRVNGNQARRRLPPRRIDLGYLVTAWARKVEDEHMMIWRALQTLKRFPVLKPEDCEGMLRHQQQNMPVLIAEPHESAFNLTDLWSVLDNQMKLGFIAIVTVELDTDAGFEAPLVLEATVSVGQSLEPSRRELTTTDVSIRHPKAKKSPSEPEEGQ